MTVVLTDQPDHRSDAADVAAWGREQFSLMGFDPTRIDLLLAAGVSWHRVDDLLRRGCSPSLAFEIVL